MKFRARRVYLKEINRPVDSENLVNLRNMDAESDNNETNLHITNSMEVDSEDSLSYFQISLTPQEHSEESETEESGTGDCQTKQQYPFDSLPTAL